MKAWGVAGAAVLALVPAGALYWQSTFGHAIAAPALAAASGASNPLAIATEPVANPAVGRVPPVEEPAVAPVEPAASPVADAVPPPKSPAAGDWAAAEKLESAVTAAMASFPGTYSVAVQDLTTGQHWVAGAGERYHPASTIKMVVSLYALTQYRAGKVSWQDYIKYTPADFESPGGGALEQAPFGSLYSIEDLINRALRTSNNIAVNMLGRYFGWNDIRAWSRTIGGELYRKPDGSPEVTVLSELGWWVYLNRLSQEDPLAAELLLKPLRGVTYTGRIPAGLPAGVAALHKFGSYDGYFHDGGIVYAAHPYAIVVLTSGASEGEADAAIARVSAGVYTVLDK